MSALLKRIREAIWPKPMAQYFMSKAYVEDIERIMPGEALIITIRGREFAMVEREEFDLLLSRAGFRTRKRS